MGGEEGAVRMGMVGLLIWKGKDDADVLLLRKLSSRARSAVGTSVVMSCKPSSSFVGQANDQ